MKQLSNSSYMKELEKEDTSKVFYLLYTLPWAFLSPPKQVMKMYNKHYQLEDTWKDALNVFINNWHRENQGE